MLLNRWARKELRRGDLGTLAELANGCGWGDPNPDRIERLSGRGFVAKKTNDKLAVTLNGRGAFGLGVTRGKCRTPLCLGADLTRPAVL
jgi:hypothetical protein